MALPDLVPSDNPVQVLEMGYDPSLSTSFLTHLGIAGTPFARFELERPMDLEKIRAETSGI